MEHKILVKLFIIKINFYSEKRWNLIYIHYTSNNMLYVYFIYREEHKTGKLKFNEDHYKISSPIQWKPVKNYEEIYEIPQF